jgi:hypothetical protein
MIYAHIQYLTRKRPTISTKSPLRNPPPCHRHPLKDPIRRIRNRIPRRRIRQQRRLTSLHRQRDIQTRPLERDINAIITIIRNIAQWTNLRITWVDIIDYRPDLLMPVREGGRPHAVLVVVGGGIGDRDLDFYPVCEEDHEGVPASWSVGWAPLHVESCH